MKFDNFFEFASELLNLSFQAQALDLDNVPGKIINSDHWKLLSGDYTNFEFPIKFKHRYGTRMRDMLDTGWCNIFLISDKIRDILHDNRFTGWKTYPIQLLNKKNGEILGYHGFSITGRCGLLDYSKSEIVHRQVLEGGPLWKYYKGYQFNFNEWDGSDFFLPKSSFEIITHRKVVDLLKLNNITNIRTTNINEVLIDEFDFELIKRKNKIK